MSPMTVRESLLRCIRQHPGDQTPRLIYADYLEDTGNLALAETVRRGLPPEGWDCDLRFWEPGYCTAYLTHRLRYAIEIAGMRPEEPFVAVDSQGIEWPAMLVGYETVRRGIGYCETILSAVSNVPLVGRGPQS